MKSLFPVFIMTLCMTIPAQARELIIAISPHQQQSEAKAQASNVLRYLTALEGGKQAIIMDGYNLQTIGTFTVPTDKRYSSPKAKLTANRAGVAALMRFAGNGVGSTNTVRLPQLLRHVAQNYAGEDGADIVVLASPFYEDSAEPEFNMTGGLIPSDGHLNMTRADTPFGIAGNQGALANIRVHMGYDNSAIMRSDRHHYFVQRFWTLFIDGQGGKLVTFTADIPALLQRVQNNAPAPKHEFKREESDKLEMIQLRRAAPEDVSIYERDISTTPLSAGQINAAQNLEIGLSWDCPDCDLDLYARPFMGTQVLYFGRSETAEGRHWKDFVRSPKSSNGYETIDFTVPVDLNALQIAVNFYGGSAPNGVRCELRLSTGGQTYAHRFTLNARSGNNGGDTRKALNDRKSTPHTILIDPLQIAGLRR